MRRAMPFIRHIQDAVADGRRFGDTPLTPNLEGLAALAGQPFFRVSRADEVGEVLSKALAVRGPALLEVDMAAVGELPAYPPYSTMGKHAERARR